MQAKLRGWWTWLGGPAEMRLAFARLVPIVRSVSAANQFLNSSV